MAFDAYDIRKLIRLRREHASGQSALILGDCAFHFPRGYLASLCGTAPVDRSSEPATREDIASALGFSRLETVDLFGSPTIKLDLQSEDIPDHLRAQFDWVIDAGTLYCCFNISRVLQNVLRFLTPSGTVCHIASLAGHFGRGYYSLSPMLFADFYAQNGFDIVEMAVRVRPRHVARRWWQRRDPVDREWRSITPSSVFLSDGGASALGFRDHHEPDEPDVLPNNSLIMCVARRRSTVPFTDAIPGYYVR